MMVLSVMGKKFAFLIITESLHDERLPTLANRAVTLRRGRNRTDKGRRCRIRRGSGRGERTGAAEGDTS